MRLISLNLACKIAKFSYFLYCHDNCCDNHCLQKNLSSRQCRNNTMSNPDSIKVKNLRKWQILNMNNCTVIMEMSNVESLIWMTVQLMTITYYFHFQSKLKKISSILESDMEGWKNQIKCIEKQKVTKETSLKECK